MKSSYESAKDRCLRAFTSEMDNILKENYQNKFDKEIAEILDPMSNFKISRSMIGIRRTQLGLNKTRKLPKPKSKGVRVPPPKKIGYPVGTEIVDKDGYVYVKVEMPNTWKLKHRLIYEQAYGEIPKGNQLLFLDQNKLNFSLDNLMVVPSNLMGVLNHKYKLTTNADINKSIVLLAKLDINTNKLIKGGKNE